MIGFRSIQTARPRMDPANLDSRILKSSFFLVFDSTSRAKSCPQVVSQIMFKMQQNALYLLE